MSSIAYSYNQLISPWCCIYAPVKKAIIISANGFLPIQCQAVIWTNDFLFLLVSLEKIS